MPRTKTDKITGLFGVEGMSDYLKYKRKGYKYAYSGEGKTYFYAKKR